MAEGIVIPHDADEPLRIMQFTKLEDYQNAVGGWIEFVQIESPRLDIIANEEGKVHGLPINKRATVMWWLLVPELNRVDALVGDIILTGARGSAQVDVPEDFRTLLLDTASYKYEVQAYGEAGHWSGNAMRFESYFEAAVNGLNLKERWTAAEKIRVVAA